MKRRREVRAPKKRKRRAPAKARAKRGECGWVIESGQCFFCSCTDDNACEEGCSWVDGLHTVCSACADLLAHAIMSFVRSRH